MKKKKMNDAELEELEKYCQDEFYYDIYEELIEDELFKPIDFFRLLDTQIEFVQTNRDRVKCCGNEFIAFLALSCLP